VVGWGRRRREAADRRERRQRLGHADHLRVQPARRDRHHPGRHLRETIGTYAARQAIQPLDDCIAKAQIDMSQYRPAAVRQVTVDGKVYGIPEFYSVRVMINNKAVKEAGLSPAEIDTTDWAKLAGMAAKPTVTKGGKLQRIGLDPKIPEFLPLWVKANGGALLSDDGKKAQLNDPKVVEALTTTAGIVQASTSSGPRTSSPRTSWSPSRWRTGT
jgi:multiple sugar transport system substrate-binding protein